MAKREASGTNDPIITRKDVSKTPIPPGAPGTTKPMLQAIEKTAIQEKNEMLSSLEKAFIQHQNPEKRRNINSISNSNGLNG